MIFQEVPLNVVLTIYSEDIDEHLWENRYAQ